MKMRKKEALTGYLLILPLMLGCTIFFAVPLGLVAWFSVVSGSGFSQVFVGVESYMKLAQNDIFRMATGNTACFLLIGITLNLCIAYGKALLMKRKVLGSTLLRSVVVLPYVMPVVGTVLLVDILFTETGLMNLLLQWIGLPMQDWLNSPSAFIVALCLYLWKNIGYSVLLLLSGLNTISGELYDASNLDGASFRQQVRYITIPQTWYSVFFAGVFSLINAFKCFREIFLIGGNHPHYSVYMLQHFINNSYEKMGYSKMAAASILLVGLLCALFCLCYWLVLRKEAYKE